MTAAIEALIWAEPAEKSTLEDPLTEEEEVDDELDASLNTSEALFAAA